MKNREYLDYVEDIVNSMTEARGFVENMDYEAFETDRKTTLAVIQCLEIVGEAVKRIPASVKNRYPEIPWKKMAGMRDKLVHEYLSVTLRIVWDTVQQDIPALKPLFERMLEGHEGK